MVLENVAPGILTVSSIPYLSNNVYGAATLVSVFGMISSIIVVLYGWRMYRKTGKLGDIAVWKE